MSQPAWKAELRTTVDAWTAGGSIVREGAFAALMPHIEAAFKRGHDAAKLRQGSRLVVENERLRRELSAHARELAEEGRRSNPDRSPDFSDGVDWFADLIDPEVST
ncbi:hypothetical protein ACFRMN_19290 [Streptomyces sp. NPDC056835]|uniref:hypothetical protein n=1 Tax=Streptomyces sp. NPDC056835 TaxID=3345956 RepID=UPI003683C8C4